MSIDTHAAGRRGGSMNGYYTWPLFGYNQSVQSIARRNHKLAAKIKADWPEARSVRDVFLSEGGPQWWSENGSDLHEARFDLRPDSWSQYIFAKYLERKAKE